MGEDVPTKPAGPVIEMEHVAVGAVQDQTRIVVEGINWRVAADDYWVVAGLQGTGKTDLLMMTGGLMAPTSGQYRLFGEPMPIFEEGRLKQRLRLGLVFDGGQLLHHLTVWENVALPLRYHRDLSAAQVEAEVQKVLEAFELAPWAGSTPGTLGRNWQKRVGLARALALQPEVLLLDSPLTGLDLLHLNWWLGTLEQLSRGHPLLQGRSLTLVLTATDLRPWQGRPHRLAVLKNKNFHPLGPADKLDPANQQMVNEFLGPDKME